MMLKSDYKNEIQNLIEIIIQNYSAKRIQNNTVKPNEKLINWSNQQ